MNAIISRKPLELIRGLALFVVLWAAVIGGVRLQLLFPRSVLVWLSQSPNPQHAMIAFGALISSSILGLIRLGIEIPNIKPLVASERVRTYLTGLPLWVIATVFALSAGGLLIVFPACDAPASVQFLVEGQPDPLFPGDLIAAPKGGTLIISAHAIQSDSILSCQWQFSGSAFDVLGSSHGCETSVKLSDQTGEGFLTLKASQNFCNQSSIFSLPIKLSEP